MSRKIAENIYQITIDLENKALRSLNSYYIKGLPGEKSLLIDAGFKTASCFDQIMSQLRPLGYEKENTDFLCTHMHTDHTALSTALAGENCQIFMHEADLDFARFRSPGTKAFEDFMHQFLEEGVPIEKVTGFEVRKSIRNADFRDPRFVPFSGGKHLSCGGYDLELIHVPGHSAGNCMIWVESLSLMLTGDHILYDITPNISVLPGEKDLLGAYLNSLRLADRYDPEITCPAHRESGDYHKRIAELLLHHDARIKECLDIVRMHPGSNAYEIAGRLSWSVKARSFEEFPDEQIFFALSETLAHLEYLRIRQKIRKEGSCRYYPG